MPEIVVCPKCRKRCKVKDVHASSVLRCPGCKTVLINEGQTVSLDQEGPVETADTVPAHKAADPAAEAATVDLSDSQDTSPQTPADTVPHAKASQQFLTQATITAKDLAFDGQETVEKQAPREPESAGAGDRTYTYADIQPKLDESLGESATIHLSIKSTAQAAVPSATQVMVRPRSLVKVEPQRPTAPADFELLEKLGEGGMGVVYCARQTTVDRAIALKMIRAEADDEEASEKFLSEAVVTADLDHPNIVPVYDLGSNEEGTLFYAMKQVKGTAWDEAIKDKPLNENIETLLRVADAVAFAHSRGVIHRDLKPENVMLGDFGEVLVMDWGLAAAITPEGKASPLTANSAVCGTPCYMAPEMALGRPEHIGNCSDVYLLGAILFECVTGERPHAGETVMECVVNAANNEIVATPMEGELLDIAHRAMATDPVERYTDVKSFQAAIRAYQEHFESTAMSGEASAHLEGARRSGEYDLFNKAIFGFEQAINLWDGNDQARQGVIDARGAYAESALAKGDLDLAGSLLLAEEASHRKLAKQVKKAQREQAARRRRIKILTTGVLGLVAAIVVILSGAFVWVNRERGKAIAAKEAEADERKKAEEATDIAEAAREEEAEARNRAEVAKALARRKEAETKDALAQAKEAIDAMLAAKDETKVAQARAHAAELVKTTLQEKLREDDKLRKNEWWTRTADEARAAQEEGAGAGGFPVRETVALQGDVTLSFVLVPPGEFGMGSPSTEEGRSGEELLHAVRINRPFYMGVHEVTRAQWKALVGSLPAEAAHEQARPDWPVTHVSFEGIQSRFLPALQKRLSAGLTCRLPTEAEWEYACRACVNTPYCSGSSAEDLLRVAWVASNSKGAPHAAGQRPANAWGLYDMHGNVAEWCQDLYHPQYYMMGPAEDPLNDRNGTHRVVRGGGWVNLPEHCRAAYRSWGHPANTYPFLGFRVVLAPPGERTAEP